MEAAGVKTGAVQAAAAASETATVAAQPSEKKQQANPEAKPKPAPRQRVEDKWKIFSGTANDALAKEVCEKLALPLGQTHITRFSDGETYVQIMENVRGADVFMIQPTCDPVDLHLMQLLLLIDALKRASARRITVVIPYFGYARQDRKDKPRVPISSKLVADLLTTAGADRALVVDLHAPQIQGFFNIPVDHLFASPVLVGHFRELSLPELTVVSPDAGGVERARFFAKKMESALAIVDKRRTGMDETEVMHVIGDVEGRSCLILDDIIDTAGTLVKTCEALLNAGAKQVYACATHPVLSGPAIERISQSELVKVVVTNTIPLTEAARNEPKIQQLSIAGLIAAAIQSIHEESSVSRLFV
ncbi:MAG TPA: ribose-phosphate pyrophosphokinase [Candidatus Eisenbacteria bacterium]|nr:ribose-phosphate pyrophosphokinase [Candidatus Eisenbacteria bacterium]